MINPWGSIVFSLLSVYWYYRSFQQPGKLRAMPMTQAPLSKEWAESLVQAIPGLMFPEESLRTLFKHQSSFDDGLVFSESDLSVWRILPWGNCPQHLHANDKSPSKCCKGKEKEKAGFQGLSRKHRNERCESLVPGTEYSRWRTIQSVKRQWKHFLINWISLEIQRIN